MESRIYEDKFKELRENIFNLLKNKNTKAIEYQKKTIEEYYNALSKGDFSQKNFKSKVAYFNGQKEKYFDEVNSAVINTNKAVKEFLDDVMVQMEAEKDSLEIQERRNDLLELNATIKRLRQDNANKMSAYDRDYQTKIKEMQNELNDKEKAYYSYSNDLARKLNVEIAKIVEKYDEKISQLEKSLLIIDDKEKIDEIKLEIKELRIKMLEDEKNIEVFLNDKEKNDKNESLNDIKEFKMALEKCSNEYRLLKIENIRSNDLLSIESDTNIFNYDIKKKDDGFNLINEIYRRKIDYFYAIRDQKRNVYARELYLKKKYNDKLFLYASINSIHPFLNLIDFILKEYDEYAKYFNKEIEAQNNFKQEYVKKTSDASLSLSLDLFNGKNKERKLFEEQNRKDVIKLLDSDLLNDEYNLIIDLFDKILNLFPLNTNKIDKKDKYLNNIYLSERNINRYDSIEKFESYMNYMETEFGNYCGRYLNSKNIEIKKFNENTNNKIYKINLKYLEGINEINKSYIDVNENVYNWSKEQKIEIDKEFNINRDKIEKKYKNKHMTL